MALLPLPIDEVLPDVVKTLLPPGGSLVLEAPPGAGKTTRAPRALLDAGLDGDIIVLEPRRLAARLPGRKLAGRLVARSLVWGVRQEASLLLRHWWPVTALLLVASRRFRRTVALALVVDARADHPDLDLISFTGSPEVGVLIQKASAERHRACVLELGGKSPQIVFADADLEAAVPVVVNAIVQNAGQTCTAGSRLLIERSAYDRFVPMLAERFRGLRVGSAEMVSRLRGSSGTGRSGSPRCAPSG